jgi:hypothetical protein
MTDLVARAFDKAAPRGSDSRLQLAAQRAADVLNAVRKD